VRNKHEEKKESGHRWVRVCLAVLLVLATPLAALTQILASTQGKGMGEQSPATLTTSEDMNQRLQELLLRASPGGGPTDWSQDYRIGANDLLSITVFEASELSRPARVSASGEITLPLIGVVVAGGLTPRELELVLQELLRRDFIKDPHVSVQVTEMESHAVSVMGAVNKPGVVQIRGSRSLLEVLALAGGLAPGAGSTVHVVRRLRAGSNPAVSQEGLRRGPDDDDGGSADPNGEGMEIELKALLESGDHSHNVFIYPGDIVKVPQADLVYVVGEVKKPGGFPLTSNGRLTVLGALALGEGVTPAAARGDTVIIRTQENGERTRIPIDLSQVLKGKAPDPSLQAQDIVFVPSSATKAIARAGADALFRMLTFRAVVF
jgi:polysaccharide export outer membrane protein